MDVNDIKNLLKEELIEYDSNLLNEISLSDIGNYARNLAKKIFNRDGGDEEEIADEIEDEVLTKLPDDLDPNADLEDLLNGEMPDEPKIEPEVPEEPKIEPEVPEEPKIEPEVPEEPEVEPGELPDQDPEGADLDKDRGEKTSQRLNSKYGEEDIPPTNQSIQDVIDGNFRTRILYQGETESKASWRFVDIYALGTSKAGNEVIRGYQAFGYTTTAIPKWKLFRVDRIKQMITTKLHYGNKPISDYSGSIPAYNKHGDKSMSIVHKNKKF